MWIHFGFSNTLADEAILKIMWYKLSYISDLITTDAGWQVFKKKRFELRCINNFGRYTFCKLGKYNPNKKYRVGNRIGLVELESFVVVPDEMPQCWVSGEYDDWEVFIPEIDKLLICLVVQ